VEKKIPGKGREYTVYNIQNQPVMTQDAYLREDDQWLYTKYVTLGRVAYTRIDTDYKGRKAIQTEITVLSTALWVTKGGTPISLGGTNIYYNNGGYPTAGISEVHTVNYYDNYTFDTAGLTVPTGNILNQPVAT